MGVQGRRFRVFGGGRRCSRLRLPRIVAVGGCEHCLGRAAWRTFSAMNNNVFASPVYLYILVAIVVSIFSALALEKWRQVRMPDTRPYGWGFYVGCMGL